MTITTNQKTTKEITFDISFPAYFKAKGGLSYYAFLDDKLVITVSIFNKDVYYISRNIVMWEYDVEKVTESEPITESEFQLHLAVALLRLGKFSTKTCVGEIDAEEGDEPDLNGRDYSDKGRNAQSEKSKIIPMREFYEFYKGIQFIDCKILVDDKEMYISEFLKEYNISEYDAHCIVELNEGEKREVGATKVERPYETPDEYFERLQDNFLQKHYM